MNVQERVLALIESQIEEIGLLCDQVTLQSNIMGEIGLSSLDLGEFISLLEEEFDIEISERDLTRIVTIQDACDVVTEKLA